jgi:hypothetical protein
MIMKMLRVIGMVAGFLFTFTLAFPQRDVQIVTSQLGFRPDSPKTVTFFAREASDLKLPDQIPFYITPVGYRRPRVPGKLQPAVWQTTPFRFPIGIDKGAYANPSEESLYKGLMIKKVTPWGIFWQADFTDFRTEGVYQIENEFAFTVPFTIENRLYERLERSFLVFLGSQRSGVEIPGVRPMLHQDDARLDSDSTFWPAAGGWYDAGDWRKWLTLTQGNVEALTLLIRFGHPVFREQALDELRWGNQYFQRMIDKDGQVFEDVAGGDLRFGYTYEEGWWVENHPGCVAGGGINNTDGIPGTSDERMIRVHYNPLAQYQFVRYQMMSCQVVEPHEKGLCLYLGEKAWNYGQQHNADRRTLFVAEELLAALELYQGRSKQVTISTIEKLARELLSRQEVNDLGLSGYFMEKDKADGYRSVAFACEPALALLRLVELNLSGLESLTEEARSALHEYAGRYLLADALSNPFGYTPYGVYVNPPYPKDQRFRETQVKDRYIRSFIHLFAGKQMPHGNGGVVSAQAYFLAKAGKLMGKPEYLAAAEKLIQWTTGHNPAGLCLATGVGFRHPVTANFVAYKIPEAMVVGFLGYPDDSPYIETSNAIEWSTQEIWDVPFAYTVAAVSYFK